MLIRLISRCKFPGELEEIQVSIRERVYDYQVDSLIVDKFELMLRKGAGFKALNYLKGFIRKEK